jgi:hypothetical protein
MPKTFDGVPLPLRIVFITAVDERPAAFGFVAANEIGADKEVAIARTSSIDKRLRFIECS